MKVIAVNGSPRKNWNTATLLEKALEGAATCGAETKLIHIYDLDFKGCMSCFACKTKEGKSYGRCAVQDGLTSLIREVEKVDAIILGSPIYLGVVTGEMRSFMERLCFPYMTYTDPPKSLFLRKIKTGFIYTFGASEGHAKERGFDRQVVENEMLLRMVFGDSESLCSFDTYQFEDYSKVVAPRWDQKMKTKRRAEVFPIDCANSFALGARVCEGTKDG